MGTLTQERGLTKRKKSSQNWAQRDISTIFPD